jgi:SAM-dependent methyltransferase
MPDASPTQPEFWNQRYADACTPWDLGAAPAALTRFLARHPGHGRRVLVPGCGSGHEIPAFADAGYQVTAIDFADEAIARVRRLCGPRREVELICGDFFSAHFAPAAFNLIYERTFLCALPLACRAALAARTAHWVKPGGHVAGLYYYGPKDDGPPFGLERDEAERLFGTHFELIDDEEIPARETLPLFAGSERWQVRRRLTTA